MAREVADVPALQAEGDYLVGHFLGPSGQAITLRAYSPAERTSRFYPADGNILGLRRDEQKIMGAPPANHKGPKA